ncbi:helix-turn-helix transcriptional regulator [Luedemannella helvata]|uniref:LuxR family transcriptional regulator n=1 Tax=Luedemannella helvata TaxID=349315 RepID=A0ABN2JTX4_9ACTN
MSQPFIGRVREREQLLQWLAAAADEEPGIVLVGGDPGIGKSRLLATFAADAGARGARVLSGACIELGEGVVPYAPLTEALRLLVRLHGPEEARALAGPAWTELAQLISDFTGADPVSGAQRSQARVFGAVLRLLDHVGIDGPVVLIFEDIHWADPSTLDLIAYLARATSRERMLLVCSHRSQLVSGHPLRSMLAEPDFTRRTHRLTLAGLSRPELRDLLSHVATRPIDRDRVQRYYELSEGNPFFAELLAAEDAASDGRVGSDDLAEIMSAQIDQVSEDALGVLRLAATAGRRVSDRLLAAVTELDERALDRALRECITRQMLTADPVEETYAFRHALLREAVYRGLLRRERKRLHAAMAEALSADPEAGPDVSLELAYHWFEAGRAQEALAASVRAGGLAVRMRAFREAEIQYERALGLWPAVTDPAAVAGTTRAEVLMAAADAARWAVHVDRAVEWARGAIAETDLEADPRRAAELYVRLGSYQWEAGSFAESVDAYTRALELSAGQPPSAVRARVLAALATADIRAGRYTEGLARAQQSIDMARDVGATAEEGRALNSAGLALTMLDRVDEGIPLLREALRIATEADHLEDRLRVYGNLGVALEHAGDLAEAVRVQLEGLGEIRVLGLLDTRQGGVLANNTSTALFLLGRWDEAVELLDEVLVDRPVRESVYLRLTRAEIDVAQGRFDDARALLDEVRSQAPEDPRFLGPLHACEAQLAMWQSDAASARAAVERGLEALGGTENSLVLLQLCAVALSAAADECVRSGTQVHATAAWVRELVAVANDAAEGRSAPREIGILARLCDAERCRAGGGDRSGMWADVAVAWTELGRPYSAAYARWREAEAAVRAADKPAATQAVRSAHAVAARLAAAPLLREVEALARLARIDLKLAGPPPSGVPRATAPADHYGLTKREREILGRVCAGETNREVARKLHIAESTVSVHVSNILIKLGVGNRTEAATVAIRERFFEDQAGLRSSA